MKPSSESESCSVMSDSCDSMDRGAWQATVHEILQARMLEWVAISFSRGSSWPRDWTHVSCVSCIGRWILYPLSHQRSPLFVVYFIPKSIWNTSSYFRVDMFHYIQNVHTKPDNTVSLWLFWNRHFSAMEMLSQFPIPENSVWLMQKSSKAAHPPACPGISR